VSFDSLAPTRLALRANLWLLYLKDPAFSIVVKMPFEPTVLDHIALRGGSEGFEVWATGSAGQKLGESGKVVDVFDGFYQAFGHLLETGLQNFNNGLLLGVDLLLAASLLTAFLTELLFECHNGRMRNRIFLRGLGVLCGQNAFRADKF